MVQTWIVRPQGILKDYIQSFELRVFDTHGQELRKPIHAFHEALIAFFIDSTQPIMVTESEHRPPYLVKNQQPFAGVMGMQTYMKGAFAFNGYYKIFNIQFKPLGFTSIFKISASVILDGFFEAEDLFNQDFKELHEQLHEAKKMNEMVGLC